MVRTLVFQLIIDYNQFIDRIISILQSNTEFAEKIAVFRHGDMPEITSANEFPLCYVTTASSPVVERLSIHPSDNLDTLPQEKVTLEFWVIIVTSTDLEQTIMQQDLHDLASIAEKILSQNIRLKDSKGQDPICVSSRVHLQGRMEQYRGKMKEAMTIRIRPVIYVEYNIS